MTAAIATATVLVLAPLAGLESSLTPPMRTSPVQPGVPSIAPTLASAAVGLGSDLLPSPNPMQAPGSSPSPSVGATPELTPKPTPKRTDKPKRVLLRGWATHCRGCWRTRFAAAVNSWRWGDERYHVRVWYKGRSVLVVVLDYCACGDRQGRPTVIDLSPEAFAALSPDQTKAGRRAFLGGGYVDVRVERP